MIDPIVAYDKLSNFETAQEIREYFQDCGIKALKADNSSCAIAQWFIETTGEQFVSVATFIKVGDPGYGQHNGKHMVATKPAHKFNHTKATIDFIDRFDAGDYPELELYDEVEG